MATDLGWLGDLVSQLLFLDGTAQTSRRAWNLSDDFTVADDAVNERTDISIDVAGLSGNTGAVPEAVIGASTSIGTAASGLARADHEHRFGRGSTTSGDRAALELAYDASAITSGNALGLTIDEETVTSGTSILLELRRNGDAGFTFRGDDVNGGTGWEFYSGDELTVANGTNTVDLAPAGSGEVTIKKYTVASSTVAASGTFDIPVEIAEDSIAHVLIKAFGAQDTDASLMIISSLATRASGAPVMEELITDRFEASGSAFSDTASSSASGSTITYTITNNDDAARDYSAYVEVTYVLNR